MITIIHAHPYPKRSLFTVPFCRRMLEQPEVQVRAIYSLYPDFSIDLTRERETIQQSDVLLFINPMHWFGIPSLMQYWFEKVLGYGWAYGEGGTALHGKKALWIPIYGLGYESVSFQSDIAIDELANPVRLTLDYCGAEWLGTIPVLGQKILTTKDLQRTIAEVQRQVLTLIYPPTEVGPVAASTPLEEADETEEASTLSQEALGAQEEEVPLRSDTGMATENSPVIEEILQTQAENREAPKPREDASPEIKAAPLMPPSIEAAAVTVEGSEKNSPEESELKREASEEKESLPPERIEPSLGELEANEKTSGGHHA